MDTIALTNFMRRDEKTNRFFKGVMPRDFLPAQLEKKGLYVINLATSTDPSGGTHWVLISTLSDFFSAYVCSLGTKPIHKNVLDSLFSVNDIIVYNDFKNQGDLATTCAWHTIWTSAMLARGHNLLSIMTDFYTNQQYLNWLPLLSL